MGGNGAHALLADHNDLAGRNIPHKVGADRIQRTTLRRHHISIVRSLTQAKRPKAIGVAKRNEFGGSHHHARECPLQPGNDFFNRLFRALAVQALLYNRIGNGLGVRCAVKNGAPQLKLAAQLRGVYQIAVMCHRQITLNMANDQGLNIVGVFAAGGGVAHMTDGHITCTQGSQLLLAEHIRHQSVAPMVAKHAVVIHGNAATLLSSVLQGKQSQVRRLGHRGGLIFKYAENTAFLVQTIEHRSLLSRVVVALFSIIIPLVGRVKVCVRSGGGGSQLFERFFHDLVHGNAKILAVFLQIPLQFLPVRVR